MPVGSVYVRFKGQPAPNTLWGGTWQNISSQYAGEFFRAEGGDAAPFGQSQAEGLPNIEGNFIAYASGPFNGCFGNSTYNESVLFNTGNNNRAINLNFNARVSSLIYGSSSHVTPKNSTVQVWKRIS